MLQCPLSVPSLISCAPGGRGKRPIGPLMLTVLPADAGLAVVVTVHAASDIAAAQAAAVSIAVR